MSPFDSPPQAPESAGRAPELKDPFGRRIDYLRVSVTDRCDLRCVYCMPRNMRFLPRPEVLSIEELARLVHVFVDLGVRKLRLTGGEPLVRRGLLDLLKDLSPRLDAGDLREIALTTNGTRLAEFARPLFDLGVRRVNVSLDTLDPERFRRLTRGGDLGRVLAGLQAARTAGLTVRINTVALARENRAELAGLVRWAHENGYSLAFIETMPLGEVEEDRTDQFLSLAETRRELEAVWTLDAAPETATGGPARNYRVRETGGVVGFITPMSDNFCADCNRVRLTCTGVLHTCLGHEDGSDLRAVLRGGADAAALAAAARAALLRKPERHDFRIGRGLAPTLSRHMSTTGG